MIKDGYVRQGMFPVLDTRDNYERVDAIPFEIVKSHEEQCKINHGGQDVETLARRGGLTYLELYAVLQDKPWKEVKDTSPADAKKWVLDHSGTKTFIVPVEWSMSGLVAVEARTAEEACNKLAEHNEEIEVPSSRYSEYIDGSFAVSGMPDAAIDACIEFTREYDNGRQFLVLNDL